MTGPGTTLGHGTLSPVDDGEAPELRPGLTLMTEYGVDVPVWHGPPSDGIGNVDAKSLAELGVSNPLIERLRAWQERWDHNPVTGSPPRDTWPDRPWVRSLASQLQAELPRHRIYLSTPTGPEPVEH